jgi:hypothetical protein
MTPIDNKDLDESWAKLEPAPLEYFHVRLFELFHQIRMAQAEKPPLAILLDGGVFTSIIMQAKADTYAKYPKQVNKNPVPKNEL